MIDIIERGRAEEKLRRSEQRHRALVSAIPDLIFRLDRNGTFIDYNASRHDLLVPPEVFLGKTVGEALPPELARQIMDGIEHAVASGELQCFEYDLMVEGKKRYFEARITLGGEEDILVVVREITVRREAQEALRLSEERLRYIARVSSDVLWDWNISTDEIWYTQGLNPEVRGPEGEATMSSAQLIEVIHPDDREQAIARLTAAMANREPFLSMEFRMARADGTYRYVLSRSHLIYGDDGRPVRAIGAIMDISERKEAEERLREHALAQTQLLHQLMNAQEAERRRLSMEIHDGPLQSVGVSLLSLDRALRRLERGEQELAEQELRFLRAGLTGTVGEVRAILADLSLEILSSYGLVFALKTHVERFSELTGVKVKMRNSVRHRLPAEIELLIYRLAQEALANIRKHADAGKATVTLNIKGQVLYLTISDDGRGFDLDAALQQREDGQKLGLRSMRQRVQAAGGNLETTSHPGKGTTLRFSCPV